MTGYYNLSDHPELAAFDALRARAEKAEAESLLHQEALTIEVEAHAKTQAELDATTAILDEAVAFEMAHQPSAVLKGLLEHERKQRSELADEKAKNDPRGRWRIAERALNMEEAARLFAPACTYGTGTIQRAIRDLAPLPPTLRAVPLCHICGSSDAVLTDSANLCSCGHFSDPKRLPGGLRAVPVAVLKQATDGIRDVLPDIEAWRNQAHGGVTSPLLKLRSALAALEAEVK